MRIDDRLDDGQSQAGTRHGHHVRRRGPEELVEDMRHVLRRDAGAGVGDGELRFAVAGRVDRDRAAGRGELDGVHHQVVERRSITVRNRREVSALMSPREHLEVAADGGERGTQFVADVDQERVAHPVQQAEAFGDLPGVPRVQVSQIVSPKRPLREGSAESSRHPPVRPVTSCWSLRSLRSATGLHRARGSLPHTPGRDVEEKHHPAHRFPHGPPVRPPDRVTDARHCGERRPSCPAITLGLLGKYPCRRTSR